MSGAFYGSLAASASVFVAILTALLVNNYVQIKSDRRQIQYELNRIEADLNGLRDRRDDYQETVDNLVEKRESDYREKAKEQVDEFIDSEIPTEFTRPIEKLTIDELYQRLIDFHDCGSAEELEDSPVNFHHKEILEERMDEIEDKILTEIIPSFASKYEGDGWDPTSDSAHTSFFERVADLENEEGRSDEESVSVEDDKVSDVEVKAEGIGREPLELSDFLNKYKQRYGIDDLDDKTQDFLEKQYEDVVDKNIYPNTSLSSSLNNTPNSYSSLQSGFIDAALTADSAGGIDDSLLKFPSVATNTVLGLNVQEQQRLEKAREDLQNKKNEIKIREQRRDRLKREQKQLDPEDLNTTLITNIITILLSVVVPIAAYLDTVTEFTISELSWVNIWMITGSWVLGLLIVFIAIYLRLNGDIQESAGEEL